MSITGQLGLVVLSEGGYCARPQMHFPVLEILIEFEEADQRICPSDTKAPAVHEDKQEMSSHLMLFLCYNDLLRLGLCEKIHPLIPAWGGNRAMGQLYF